MAVERPKNDRQCEDAARVSDAPGRACRPAHGADDFDEIAARTLVERRAEWERIPDPLTGLPELSCQVLHGDYSSANLLFDSEALAAVVDFSPPGLAARRCGPGRRRLEMARAVAIACRCHRSGRSFRGQPNRI
ncbi:phosphotransferase [Pseudonocardia sp. Cha107L01]|uniref:phosphotransferase n=1 Tax=Pseudonocardia sp. Cha107L01 TaxID=3457576 RepID=UPI00403E967A